MEIDGKFSQNLILNQKVIWFSGLRIPVSLIEGANVISELLYYSLDFCMTSNTVSRCRTRGESQEFMAHRWRSMQARDPPWLWNPGETSSEVQNRGISGATKITHVLQKNLKKKRLLYDHNYSMNTAKNIHEYTHRVLCSKWKTKFSQYLYHNIYI